MVLSLSFTYFSVSKIYNFPWPPSSKLVYMMNYSFFIPHFFFHQREYIHKIFLSHIQELNISKLTSKSQPTNYICMPQSQMIMQNMHALNYWAKKNKGTAFILKTSTSGLPLIFLWAMNQVHGSYYLQIITISIVLILDRVVTSLILSGTNEIEFKWKNWSRRHKSLLVERVLIRFPHIDVWSCISIVLIIEIVIVNLKL